MALARSTFNPLNRRNSLDLPLLSAGLPSLMAASGGLLGPSPARGQNAQQAVQPMGSENKLAPGRSKTAGAVTKASVGIPTSGASGEDGLPWAPPPVRRPEWNDPVPSSDTPPRPSAEPRPSVPGRFTPSTETDPSSDAPPWEVVDTPSDYDEWAQAIYDLLLSGAGAPDYMQYFEPQRQEMLRRKREGMADIVEQFGHMGAQFGSGAIKDVSDFSAQREGQIDALLGQLALGAEQGQAGRMMQGASLLANMLYGSEEGAADRQMQLLQLLMGGQMAPYQLLAQLGMGIQGFEQGELDRLYQDWLSQLQGFRPEMLSALGIPVPYSYGQYQPGMWDQMAPIIGALLPFLFGNVGGGGGAFDPFAGSYNPFAGVD